MELNDNEKMLANLGDDLLHKIQTCKKAIHDLEEFIKNVKDYDETFDDSDDEKSFKKLRKKLYKRFVELEIELENEYKNDSKTNKETRKTK